MFRGIVLALFAIVALSSPALAGGGGGGTKKDATVKFILDTPSPPPAAVFIVNPSSALATKLETADPTLTTKTITDAGGKVVRAGSSGSVSVKAGNVVVYAAALDAAGNLTGAPIGSGKKSYSVAKGKTLEVKASAF